MLFTDERPNVGNTHEQGFMTMARAASHDGIGLTTIGVGVQFDAELATTIGSVRGGNLFFMRDEDDVKQVFRDEFDYMVSELAHDLAISITPQPGYTVAGVYGVPDTLMGWQNERTVKITLPTVFLSSKGGALFVALAKSREDANLPPARLQTVRLWHPCSCNTFHSVLESSRRIESMLSRRAPSRATR